MPTNCVITVAKPARPRKGDHRLIISVTDPQGTPIDHHHRDLNDDDTRTDVARRIATKTGDDPDEIAKELLRQLYQMPPPPPLGGQAPGGQPVPYPYEITPGGLVWNKETPEGTTPVPLTTFGALIVGQVVEDDGVETRRLLEIEGDLRGRTYRFQVPAGQFPAMAWPMEHMGAGAALWAGVSTRDHARAAIQFLSYANREPVERRVYAHTGWCEVDGQWLYLHAGGAIGPVGSVPDIEVSLPEQLRRYSLPDPPTGERLRQVLRGSLKVLDVARDTVTVPILASVYRSVLGDCDLSVFVCGESGAGKTAEAVLGQQHYGSGMDALHLPASWESTANAIQVLGFHAKDALMVVDDFAPTGSASDIQHKHREADRVFRSQANKSPRNRLSSNSSLRPPKEPRGLIFATGEDVPKGYSLGARMLKLDQPKTGPGAVDWDKLTECQEAADRGVYAQALSGYIRHLATNYERMTKGLPADVNALRSKAYQDGQHRRTPGIVADLAVGFRYFLDFAEEVGAIEPHEYEKLWDRAWNALIQVADEQGDSQRDNDPAFRFLELVNSCLSSGRAHLASTEGKDPYDAIQWGWRNGHQSWDFGTEYQPQGKRIGWIDGSDIYLDSQAAYAEVQELARHQGDSIAVTLITLKKRLHDKRLLASTELDGTKVRLEVRHRLQGRQRRVLHILERTLVSYHKKVDSVDSDTPDSQDFEEDEHDNTPNEDTEPEPTHEPTESTSSPSESTFQNGVDSKSAVNNFSDVVEVGGASPLSPLFYRGTDQRFTERSNHLFPELSENQRNELIAAWDAQGQPSIELGPGEVVTDLRKALSGPVEPQRLAKICTALGLNIDGTGG
jgi:hypothetical protein